MSQEGGMEGKFREGLGFLPFKGQTRRYSRLYGVAIQGTKSFHGVSTVQSNRSRKRGFR
jgi:hypothetical protein